MKHLFLTSFFCCFSLFSFSQEALLRMTGNRVLRDVYPNGVQSYVKVIPDSVGYLRAGEQVSVYAYDKRLSEVYVYSKEHAGKIFVDEKYLLKTLKKQHVLEVNRKQSATLLSTVTKRIRETIDNHYNLLDSLRRRNEFVADSIAKVRSSARIQISRKWFAEDSLMMVYQLHSDSLDIRLQEEKDAENVSAVLSDYRNVLSRLRRNTPILVNLDEWSTDEVNGITLKVSVINCSMQTIKYITFQLRVFNAVMDPCHNELFGGSVMTFRGIGPIGPREKDGGINENCTGQYNFDNPVFYSRLAKYLRFSSLTIEYMNGKKQVLTGQNLKAHVTYEDDFENSVFNPFYISDEATAASVELNEDESVRDKLKETHSDDIEAMRVFRQASQYERDHYQQEKITEAIIDRFLATKGMEAPRNL